MCEIAPFGIKCMYEHGDCLMRHIYKANYALTEIGKSLPIIGRSVKDYYCPSFEVNEIEVENDL